MTRLEEHKQKLRQIIERECDGSRMNDTKWMEMLDALRDVRFYYRVKFLDSDNPTNWLPVIVGGFSSGLPTPYIEGPSSPEIVLAIEWMEIDPKSDIHRLVKVDRSQEVEERLQSVNVPYTWEGSIIRVTGHVRKTVGRS